MRAICDFLVNNFGVYFESGSEVFLWFFNRAIAASWLILAVIVLRILIKRAPKCITCALWGICALRLVLPFSLQSVLSLIPSAQTVVPESIYENRPQIDSGIPIIDNNVNSQITEQYFEGVTVPEGSTISLTSIVAIIWIIGILALVTYALVSYVKLRKRVKGATMLEKGVFESAGVSSPFILGIFSPKIHLPLNMDEETKTYVLSHERAHLSRGDHIFKPLGFVILSLYWFSPLVWVAYIFFCRDIELACDERVVSKLEKNNRADYAQAILDCAIQKKGFSACPLAFGEVSIKDRVKSALSYKKPVLWVIIASLIVAIVVSALFVTDPIRKKNFELTVTGYNSPLKDISITLSSADVNSERPYITVNWKNDTDEEFGYDEDFSLKRYKNGRWEDCAKGEVFFKAIAYLISPNSSSEHTYYLDGFDISKAGKYKFSTSYNNEFEIYFTLTKTSGEVNGFTDLTKEKENTSSSTASSNISKDETSSQPTTSDKNNISSKDEESSAPTPVSSKDEDPISSAKNTSSETPVVIPWDIEKSPSITVKRFDNLSEEKEKKISACAQKEDYEYQGEQYFGTYNGYDVVLISKIDGAEYRDAHKMNIAGCEFLIGDTEKLVAYKNNAYIPLSEAYSKGSITNGEIQNIWYLYRYSFYYKFADYKVSILVKRRVNDYTAADFPTIKMKSIEFLISSDYEGQSADFLILNLPIKNRRNVVNVIEELKKYDYVFRADPNYYSIAQ